MFSKRFFSLFLLIFSFGVFVGAKPISNHVVAIRGLEDVSKNDVTGPTRRQPCNCPQDLLNALNALQEECNPLIDQLNGQNDPVPIVAQLVANINASTKVIATIQINGCVVTSVIVTCVQIIVRLIVKILAGLLLYPSNIVAELYGPLNVCITAWVRVIIQICPVICLALEAALAADTANLRIRLPSLVALLGI